MLTEKSTGFRAYLQDELLRRCRGNTSYSLRAYAKTLGISPSALSAILNSKRPLTTKTARRLGLALGLNLSELAGFPEFHENSQEGGREDSQEDRKNGVAKSQQNYLQLSADTFALISEWYHFAILELLKTDGFKQDAKWIAKRLGITASEVNFAVERLKRVGLLRVDEDGHWCDSGRGFTSSIQPEYTDQARKNLQKEFLRKSIESINEVPIEKRDQTGMTMAIHSKNIALAKEKIKKFRREMSELLEADGDKDEVYQLSVSFFPLTESEKSTGESR